jgi:antitoxin component HigA of HigAB toxin-antitoxin module
MTSGVNCPSELSETKETIVNASLATINPQKYATLLVASLPQEITTDEENEARIKELEAFSFADDITVEEEAYVRVLTILIEKYEQRYRLSRTLDPIQALKILMANRNLKRADLVPAIDSKSHVSGLLDGKGDLSKTHIQKIK